MAGKISDLTAISTPASADLFEILDSSDPTDSPEGSSRKITYANLVSLTALGITASATELNVLDGIPVGLTATELGYVDGVTSAIQTQLDGKQPLDSDLTSIAGLSPSNDDIIQRKSGSWANRTMAQLKTDLSLAKADVGLGNVDNTSDSTKNSATATLTNKRITKRVGTTTSSATPTINTDNVDMYIITAQTEAITSFTTNLSGTPTQGQTLWIAITGTASRAITWGASFEASTIPLPTTTDGTNRLDVGFVWNTVTSKWRVVAVA